MRLIELPQKIKKLMISGSWKAKEDCVLNQELKIHHNWSGNLELFNNLEKNDCGLINISKKESKEIFGVYKMGELEDKSNLDWVDANKSIMIGCNYDEEAICLDYRFSKTLPRIIASDYSIPKNFGRWREIAKNENELIEKLGIKISN